MFHIFALVHLNHDTATGLVAKIEQNNIAFYLEPNFYIFGITTNLVGKIIDLY